MDRKETVAVESVKAGKRPSISYEKSLFSSILNKSSDADTYSSKYTPCLDPEILFFSNAD